MGFLCVFQMVLHILCKCLNGNSILTVLILESQWVFTCWTHELDVQISTDNKAYTGFSDMTLSYSMSLFLCPWLAAAEEGSAAIQPLTCTRTLCSCQVTVYYHTTHNHIEKNHWLCNSLKIETKTTPNTKTTNIQAVISMVFRNNAWIRNDKS